MPTQHCAVWVNRGRLGSSVGRDGGKRCGGSVLERCGPARSRSGSRSDRQVSRQAIGLSVLARGSHRQRFVGRGSSYFPGGLSNRNCRAAAQGSGANALPGFIEQEPVTVAPADVALAACHLSRYVRRRRSRRGSEWRRAVGELEVSWRLAPKGDRSLVRHGKRQTIGIYTVCRRSTPTL